MTRAGAPFFVELDLFWRFGDQSAGNDDGNDNDDEDDNDNDGGGSVRRLCAPGHSLVTITVTRKNRCGRSYCFCGFLFGFCSPGFRV